VSSLFFFFFQAEDGIRDFHVTGVQTCALPISANLRCHHRARSHPRALGRDDPRRRGYWNDVSHRVGLWLGRSSPARQEGRVNARSEERRVGKEWRCRWWAEPDGKQRGGERGRE